MNGKRRFRVVDALVIVVSLLIVAWAVGGETVGLRSLAEATVIEIEDNNLVGGGVFCADNVFPSERFRELFVALAREHDLWIAPDETGDYCTRTWPFPEGGWEAVDAMPRRFRVRVHLYGGVAHVDGYWVPPEVEGVIWRCGCGWDCWFVYTGRGWIRVHYTGWIA